MSIQVGKEDGVHWAQCFKLIVQKGGTPTWRLVRQYQQSGSTTPVLSRTSQSPCIFEIPPACVNLSKTNLVFDMTDPSDNAALVNYQAANRLPFQSVKLYTRSGTYLMNIENNCAKWSEVIRPRCTKLSKFLCQDPGTPGTGAECRECMNKSNYINTSNQSMYAGLSAAQGNTPSVSYTEPKYIVQTANGTSTVRRFQINLGDCFPETILGMPQDIYFNGQVMLLEFDFEPAQNYSWGATNANDAVTGAAQRGGNTPPTIANFWLDLA